MGKKGIKSGIYKKCLTCGNEFYVYQSEINSKKYCSLKCRPSPVKGKKQSKEWVEKRAEACKGKTGHIPFNKGVRTGEIIKCLTCGKEIYKQLSSIAKRSFCSRECSYKYNRGENVYNYKDGKNISAKHTWIRQNSKKFKQWRKSVLERDGYVCRICQD